MPTPIDDFVPSAELRLQAERGGARPVPAGRAASPKGFEDEFDLRLGKGFEDEVEVGYDWGNCDRVPKYKPSSSGAPESE
jgi:hypothetical protein